MIRSSWPVPTPTVTGTICCHAASTAWTVRAATSLQTTPWQWLALISTCAGSIASLFLQLGPHIGQIVVADGADLADRHGVHGDEDHRGMVTAQD